MSNGPKGDNDPPIPDFDEAIRLNPKNAAYFCDRGTAYYKKGQYDRAISDYDEAIRLNPKNAVYFSNRGSAYRQKSQYDRAMADFDEARRLNPQNAHNFLNRGETYAKQGQYDRAIADFDEAIRLEPKVSDFFAWRGFAYHHKGQSDRAIADYDEAIRLNPTNPNNFLIRGSAYRQKSQYDRAIADYDEAIRLDPTNAPVYRARREQAKHNAHAVHPPTGAQNTILASAKSLTGFFRRLAQYYAEFLSTDFKKQRLPRRRLENADAQGRLVGIPLRKYPGFQQKLWEELAKPIGAGVSLTVSRGSWRSVLPKAIVETTATYIAQVTQKDVDGGVDGVMKNALRLAKQKGDDPDIAFEQFIEEVRASLARGIIGPLLDRMEGFFTRTENKPVESLRELEDQLSARLASGIENASGAAFSKLLVEGAPESLEGLLRDQLEINLVRGSSKRSSQPSPPPTSTWICPIWSVPPVWSRMPISTCTSARSITPVTSFPSSIFRSPSSGPSRASRSTPSRASTSISERWITSPKTLQRQRAARRSRRCCESASSISPRNNQRSVSLRRFSTIWLEASICELKSISEHRATRR